MEQLNIEQGSPEWHELRKNHIGSSDAPVIMIGEHFGKTPYKLWEEKLGLRMQEKENWGMSMGTKNESLSRRLMEKHMSMNLLPATIKSSESDFALASVDAISADGKVIGEIKWPDEETHLVAVKGHIPAKYLPQLAHIMYVTEVEYVMYQSNWMDPQGIHMTAYVKLERDDTYIKKLLDKEREFWECKKSFIAPPFTDKDFVQRDDTEWRSAVGSYNRMDALLREVEEKRDNYREALITLAGGQNTEGHGVRLTNVVRKGNVDYSKVPQLDGIDLDVYRKAPSESWRITKK